MNTNSTELFTNQVSDPTYEGQQMLGKCPVTHRKGKRVARFRDGELLWFCFCKTPLKTKQI